MILAIVVVTLVAVVVFVLVFVHHVYERVCVCGMYRVITSWCVSMCL